MGFNRACLLAGLGLLAAGCGGGGGGGSDSASASESGAPFNFGNLEGRAAATNPPLTTNSAQVAATALTGTITALRIRDQIPVPDEQRLVIAGYYDGDIDSEIAVCNVDGSELTRLTSNNVYDGEVAASPDGKRIAFVSLRDGNIELYMMNVDGSGVTRLTTSGGAESAPSWTPDSGSIVYGRDGDLFKVNVTTKAVTTVLDDPYHKAYPSVAPDGKWVYYAFSTYVDAVDTTTGLSRHIRYGSNGIINPRISPNGLDLLAIEIATLYRSSIMGEQGLNLGVAMQAAWSQDGSRIAFTRNEGGIGSLFTVNRDGANLNRLPIQAWQVDWLPAPKDRTFIGSSGAILGTRAAGFIVGRSGPTVQGLVAWDATTSSSVVVTKQTGENTSSPNLVFSVDADNLTYISYANNAYFKKISVVGTGLAVASADGALIDLDSKTGKVVAVIPFVGTRSERSYREEGSTRVFEGTFLGVFDAEGKNLAPSGASRVEIDASGQIQAS